MIERSKKHAQGCFDDNQGNTNVTMSLSKLLTVKVEHVFKSESVNDHCICTSNMFLSRMISVLLLLFIMVTMIHPVLTQCFAPKWETTCQKYCLDHKFYNIQLNQCWSKDPNKLICKCNDHDFTTIIKGILGIPITRDLHHHQ